MRLRDVRFAAALGALAFILSGCSSGTDTPVATSISVTPNAALNFISLNATQQLTARVLDQHGDSMSGQVITFGSNAVTVATVSSSGLVTAKGNGSAIITLTSGSLQTTVNVSVAQAAAALTKSGDAQSGTVSSALSNPIGVTVTDAGGAPIAGVSVAFAATGGGSVAPTTANTNAAGSATSTWTLGPGVGSQSATATITGQPAATFTATAAAAPTPAVVALNSGGGQVAQQGTAMPSAVVFRVTSSLGAAVPGATVNFAVLTGGGSVAPTSATTDANGLALTNWTAGSASISQTVSATVGALTPSVATGTGLPAGTSGGFQIHVANVGPPFSAAVQVAFDSAVAFWQRAITGDLADIAGFGQSAGQCGTGSPAISSVNIDDLLILARFDAIDGPGGVLGSAGPCFVRTTGRLTIEGTMRFDTADVATLIAQGSLNAVIRHEMGHVLGFGSLWTQTQFNCLQLPSATGNVQDTYFSCANGLAQFSAIGGDNYTGGNKVPVENCGPSSPAGCGTGTVNSHWREPTFFNEMMTGYLNSGVANPASVLTLGAMADLGYVVDLSAAESYTRTFTSAPTLQATPGPVIDLRNDVYSGPLYEVDAHGRILGRINR